MTLARLVITAVTQRSAESLRPLPPARGHERGCNEGTREQVKGQQPCHRELLRGTRAC